MGWGRGVGRTEENGGFIVFLGEEHRHGRIQMSGVRCVQSFLLRHVTSHSIFVFRCFRAKGNSVSTLRAHLERDHLAEYQAVVDARGWGSMLPKAQAEKIRVQRENADSTRPPFSMAGLYNQLVKVIVTNDLVRQTLFFLPVAHSIASLSILSRTESSATSSSCFARR